MQFFLLYDLLAGYPYHYPYGRECGAMQFFLLLF